MHRLLLIAALAVAVASPAIAGERVELKPNDPVTLDSAHAYVLVQIDGSAPLSLVRRVSETEMAEWLAKKLEKEAKARKRYARDILTYREDQAAYLAMRPSQRIPGDKPKVPEVVDENFYVPPPELDHMVAVNGREYAPASSGRWVLLNLQPGNYDVYAVGGAASGTCLCMGSIGFSAVPGKIVSLGRISAPDKGSVEFRFAAAAAADAKPATLASVPVEPAQVHAVGRMPNYFGSTISRIAEVPGLFSYRDGVPLDASGKEPAAIR